MSKKTTPPSPDRRIDGELYDNLKSYLELRPLGESFVLWRELQQLPEIKPKPKPATKRRRKAKPALVPDGKGAPDSGKTAEDSG